MEDQVVLTSELLTKIIIAFIGCTGLWTFLGKIFDAWLDKRKRKRQKKDNDASQTASIEDLQVTANEHTSQLAVLVEAVMLLIYDRFEHLAERYLEDGKITLKQSKVCVAFYKAYKALGGDGWADELLEKLKKLPIE